MQTNKLITCSYCCFFVLFCFVLFYFVLFFGLFLFVEVLFCVYVWGVGMYGFFLFLFLILFSFCFWFILASICCKKVGWGTFIRKGIYYRIYGIIVVALFDRIGNDLNNGCFHVGLN